MGRKLALASGTDPSLMAGEGAPSVVSAPGPAGALLMPFASMEDICPGINADNMTFPQVALLRDVVPLSLAAAIIAAAEAHAAAHGGWTTDRHAYYPTTDLNTADVPALAFLVPSLVLGTIMPRLAAAFGLNPLQLGISEVFIARYSADIEGHQRSLDAHLDGSDFSFVVALNDGFQGGGTRFEGSGKVRAPPAGSAVTFCGQNRHAGLPITAGTRYILAGFIFFGEPGGCQFGGVEGEGDDGKEASSDPDAAFEVRPVEDGAVAV